MKTPPQYTKNLKNKIITEEMLINCLYSSNKRAKNYRDKISEYRNYFRSNRFAYDKYGNIEKFNLKKKKNTITKKMFSFLSFNPPAYTKNILDTKKAAFTITNLTIVKRRRTSFGKIAFSTKRNKEKYGLVMSWISANQFTITTYSMI